MDAAGALSELGLEAPTSAEQVRRAYLKAVRIHSPERDPEGFRRVRDAYELLKDAPWLWGADEPTLLEIDGLKIAVPHGAHIEMVQQAVPTTELAPPTSESEVPP